jgi:hypothetical protein
MATIRTKLKQLRNADVRYISLVDRAATRIPFRVLKRDKESKMGIDLTSVFKSDAKVKPHVSALVVFAQKDETAGNQVRDAIKAHGFIIDKVQKSDEGETLVYAQGDQPKDVQIVRLSEQTLVSVAGLKVPQGWIGELVEEHGFFPDLKLATSTLYDRMADIVSKSEEPQEEAQAVLTSYAEYLSQMAILPANCFKLDVAIADIVKKCSCETKDEKKEEVVVKESPEEQKKRIKDHPPSEMAPCDEEDDQKGPPEEVEKKDNAILAALKSIEATVTGLATKVEAVVTEQAEQKKTLDGVVQKADTLNTTLKATVTAVPVSEDRPSMARMRVQKDDDPRTGNFDTAFLRRRR